jgi:uncharacterized protein (TIGR02246 family)
MAAESPQELVRSFVESMNEGDVDGAISLWTEDAVIVTAEGEPLAGRALIRQALEAMSANGTSIEIEIENLYEAGDVALVAGVLTLSGGAGETQFRTQAKSTVVYRRGEDGTWRIALDAPWGLPGR